MSNIAIITARGGSKRIPRKNIRLFCGKPIIAYSIEAAMESGLFDVVMVSTDDKSIADISKEYGATVPFFRSKKTSDDYSSTEDVLDEVIQVYKDRKICFDYMCCIYPTAPFINAEKIKKGYETLIRTGADRVDTVVKYECPPQWALELDRRGFISFLEPEKVDVRSQDLQCLYHDAGQFYWYVVNNCFYEKNDCIRINSLILEPNEVQDIDDEDDWNLAELKYLQMIKKNSVSPRE